MSTINISLPSEQVNFIDGLVKHYGFANRSEFVRSLLRLVKASPSLVTQTSTFPFVAPKERSVKKIVNAFSKNKKYSKEFLSDLEKGLASSDYFSS